MHLQLLKRKGEWMCLYVCSLFFVYLKIESILANLDLCVAK